MSRLKPAQNQPGSRIAFSRQFGKTNKDWRRDRLCAAMTLLSIREREPDDDGGIVLRATRSNNRSGMMPFGIVRQTGTR
jgi:hypothetical protein